MKKIFNIKDLGEYLTVPRRWFPLWILDWYILREFLVKYCILMLVFIILFVLSDVYNYIYQFIEAESPISDIIKFLLVKMPGNIRFILPISMLLGCMWCMATFGKNLEITAMRASGISLFRCGAPIFAVGLFVTGINIYFNEILVPKTENMAERIYATTEKRRPVQHLLAYRSSDGKRNWLFKTFVKGESQNNVTLRTFWEENLIRQLIGEPGTPECRAKVLKLLPLHAPRILALDRAGQKEAIYKALHGRKIDIFAGQVDFDRKRRTWTFSDGYFVSFDRRDEHDISASRGTSQVHQEEKFAKILFNRKEIPERPDDITNAVREKDELSTAEILDLVRRNTNMPDRVRCIYMTLFYYRISFPWACLIAVFLGIPLATRNERTGSLLAVISAVVIIVVYVVIAQVFLIFGKAGVVPPLIAGTLPTVAFIGYGVWRVFFDRN